MAFVVPAPGAEVDPDELIAWARGTMANYKVPRAVEIVDDLPVNAGGQGREGHAARPRAAGTGRDRPWTPATRRSSSSCGAATAALVADLGPRTVDDLDDDGRRGAPRRRRRSRSGWFELRGPGEDDGPLASGVEVAIVARELGGPRPTRRSSGPCVAADLARQAGLELEDGGASVVLDPHAARPRRRARRRVGRRRRGRLRGRGTRPRARRRRATTHTCRGRRCGHADAPATDLTRALAPVTAVADVVDDALDGAAGRRRRDRAEPGARRSRSRSPISSGTMEGALDTTCEYAKERQQYGVAIGSFQAVQHLLAEARVLVEGSISVAQYAAWAVDALPPAEALEAGVGGQGVLRRAPPAPCARPPSRCTAGSATPGSASCTCTCAARCCRARCSATRATTCVRWHAVDWETTVDFDDSPEEAAFRARIRAWLADNNPGSARVVDRRRVLGPAGRVALRAVRRRVLRAHVAEAHTAATSCRRSTRSSSTRSWPRPARRPSRASATSSRASPGTAATRCATASSPADQRARPVVPGLQRARRRLRPRVVAHARGARRRRVRHRRAQGLDELLRRRRLVPAPRPHRSRRCRSTRASRRSRCRCTSPASSSGR